MGNNQKSQRGSALVSVMTGVALLSVTMFSSMAYLDFLTTQNASLKRDFSISLVKSNILRTLQSPSAWMNTINDDTNLFKSCTADPVNCLAVKNFVPLNVHDIEDKVLITGTQGTWYDHSGKLCTGEACPVLVTSRWKGVCNSEGTCTQVYVELDFQIRDKSGTQSKSRVGLLKNYFIGTTQKSLTTGVTFTSGDVSNATAKIIVILDSSESMVDNFAKVKQGLSGIMTKLAGKPVEVYFYTTASLELYYYTSFASDTQYLDYKKVSAFLTKKIDDNNYQNYLAVDMSRKIASPIDPGLDEASILSRLDNIFATYIAVPGSDKESGICTLQRILMDEGPNKILSPNDLAYFIIVSDEDDTQMMTSSDYNYCHRKIERYSETMTVTKSVPCDPAIESCDRVKAATNFTGPVARIEYTAKVNDTYGSYYYYLCKIDSDNNEPGYSPCPFSPGTFTCGAAELKVINPDGTKNITSCSIRAITYTTSHYAWEYNTPSNALSLVTNFCSGAAFTLKSVSYTSLTHYLSTLGYPNATPSDCKIGATKYISEEDTYTRSRYTRMNGTTTIDSTYMSSTQKLALQNHLISTLKTRFGETGFGVKAFIQDPVKDTGLCSLTDGSYGITYANFITALASPYSGYESICNDTYNFSFETLGNNILATMNNTYIFNNLTSTDKITGISITRSGTSFTLSPDRYEVVGNKVIFKEGSLQPEDQITLILADGIAGSW